MTNDIGIIDISGQNKDIPDFMRSPTFQEFAMNQMLEIHKMGSMGRMTNIVSWPALEFQISREKFLNIKSSGGFDNWYKNAFAKYLEIKHPFGSVDKDPQFWAKLIFAKCSVACFESSDEFLNIKVQNGCCSQDKCPLTFYFNALVEGINT
jgi:hypothetical protein